MGRRAPKREREAFEAWIGFTLHGFTPEAENEEARLILRLERLCARYGAGALNLPVQMGRDFLFIAQTDREVAERKAGTP